MSLITQSRGIGRAKKTTDPNVLMSDLGLGVSLTREAKRLQALTDPEAYITARMTAQKAIGENVLAVYSSQHTRYKGMGYPDEMADLKAKEFARNVASLELKSVEEEFPELSSSAIMSANAGNAVREYRKKSKGGRGRKEAERLASAGGRGGRGVSATPLEGDD